MGGGGGGRGGKGGGVRRKYNEGRDGCFSSPHGALTLLALCLVVQSGVIVEDGKTKSAECACTRSI